MNPLIFVIEDDLELGETFADILADGEIDVKLIDNGQLALTMLAHHVPDLIFLDLHMPGISGIDILKEIRASDRLAKVPVAVITADALRGQLIKDSADLVLIKPIKFAQVIATRDRFLAAA